MSGGDFVKVENVSKSFGDNKVLSNVSLQVAAHDVVCLIGASGSGKSTLLRCINLLEKVDAGTIVVDGQNLTTDKLDVNKLRQHIGIVFQAYNLFPHMTVLQNVTLSPRKTLGLSKKQAEARAYELLDRIGLQKDTAIVYIIGIGEAVLAAQNYSTAYTNFTGYTVAAVFFVILTIPLARFTDSLIRQRELRERAAA